MTTKQIHGNLCIYDPRYPDCDYGSDEKPENCSCDNCFYGRNLLALELLNLREALQNLERRATFGTISPEYLMEARQILSKTN